MKNLALRIWAICLVYFVSMSFLTRWEDSGTALVLVFTLPAYVVVGFVWSLFFAAWQTNWKMFFCGLATIAISWLAQQWLVPTSMPIHDQSYSLLVLDVAHILNLIIYCALSFYFSTEK